MVQQGFWREKRVIVTGGTGFLGTHVVEALRAAGCERVVALGSKDYDLVRESDVERLFAELGGPGQPIDVFFHVAGLVGGIQANRRHPAQFFYQNLMMGTLTLHNAWKHGAGKYIAVGAGCGYPEFAPIPTPETAFWTGFPQQDSFPYSLAKRMLDIQGQAYWMEYGFPVIVGVPGNIYGPYDNFDPENAHVVPALVRRFVEAADSNAPEVVVWGSGAPTRDFVYAGDVAEGLLLAAETYQDSQLVNLSSGHEDSVREVVEHLVALTGYRGTVTWDTARPEGQARRSFDVSKAQRELGFATRTALRDGLERTVAWYRANRTHARNSVPIG